MPRPRLYNNQAERQAAYRARHPEQKPPREDLLAALARSLHFVLEEAAENERCLLPVYLVGLRPEQTLSNLIRYFDSDPDPIRYVVKDTYTQPSTQTTTEM